MNPRVDSPLRYGQAMDVRIYRQQTGGDLVRGSYWIRILRHGALLVSPGDCPVCRRFHTLFVLTLKKQGGTEVHCLDCFEAISGVSVTTL